MVKGRRESTIDIDDYQSTVEKQRNEYDEEKRSLNEQIKNITKRNEKQKKNFLLFKIKW